MSEPIESPVRMTEFPLVRRPPIVREGVLQLGGLALTAPSSGQVLQLMARPGTVTKSDILTALEGGEAADLRPAGPGQWLLVCDSPSAIAMLERQFGARMHVVDQTHGRSRIQLSGQNVRQVLAKATGVDLHPAEFPVGHAVMTLLGHIGANLARTGDNIYELLVLRGFAESLWGELQVMAAEYAGGQA
ncbi:sarcosine oxidase subunit gamma family protein [Rhizobium sp. FY34]|uniref:sarcosine oxidase subunit gamma n=1 Tax=Rhizobium sp. FY34 TaxID=2562309 RepID=UPI001485A0DD|nr:sarcosine oxidase subunit gamma family protein [Rhizobium sp. FY34]